MTIMKVLDTLDKLESKISELYGRFSRSYDYDTEAASLFYRTSIDESAHANLVRYVKRLAAKKSTIFSEVSLDPAEAAATLEVVTSILADSSPSLEQAVKISLDIESSLAEAHYRAAIAQGAPDISQLLHNLEGFDSRHIEVFGEFAVSRNYPFSAQIKSSPDKKTSPGKPLNKTNGGKMALAPELREKIQYYYDYHVTMNFYKLLGINNSAASDDIKMAFRTLAHEFHPDRYMSAEDEVLRKLHTIFAHMTVAYSTLMDPTKRRDYDMKHPRPRK
jgi:hypothetical protein